MHCWHDVKPARITPENFLSLIEISKGSKIKWPVSLSNSYLFLLPLEISISDKKFSGVILVGLTSCQQCIIGPPIS